MGFALSSAGTMKRELGYDLLEIQGVPGLLWQAG